MRKFIAICNENARYRVEGEKHNSITERSIFVSKSCDRNGLFGFAQGKRWKWALSINHGNDNAG